MRQSLRSENAVNSPYAIVPLLYFNADWSEDRYDFEPGVHVIRATAEATDMMVEAMDSAQTGSIHDIVYKDDGIWALRHKVQWLLVTSSFSHAAHVPAKVIHGPICLHLKNFGDFSADLLTAYREGFLTALNVVKSHCAIVPLIFKGYVDLREDDAKVARINGCEILLDIALEGAAEEEMAYSPANRHWPELFDEADAELVRDVWSGLARLRDLKKWADRACTEQFFQELDRKAGQKRAAYLTQESDHDKANAIYEKEIRREFQRIHKQNMAGHTRLGRALTLFESALGAQPVHAFITMCTVLEGLYIDTPGELTHKLKTRLAKLVGKDLHFEERKRYSQRVQQVYKARSRIVHGEVPIESVGKDVQKDAFLLVRRSLQHILKKEDLLSLFGAAQRKTSCAELRDYLLRLDLGGE